MVSWCGFRWIPRMVFVVVLNTFAFVSDLQAIRETFVLFDIIP
jgi:hypothetical protein